MIFAIDICNTIADVNRILDQYFSSVGRTDTQYYHPGITDPDFFRKNIWIFKQASAFPGSAETLQLLSSRGEILYLTARPEEARIATGEWLKANHFPAGKLIMETEEKAYFLKQFFPTEQLVALEDSPLEITEYQSAGIPVLVHAQGYNTGFSNRFTWGTGQVERFFYEKLGFV